MSKGNMEEARIYAENSVRNHNEHVNYLRLAARLDAVISRLQTQAKIISINTSLNHIVKSLDSSNNLQNVSETMARYDKQSMQISVQSELIENSITRSTSLLTPEDQIKTLMRQVAHDSGLELSISLPSPAAHAVPTKSKCSKKSQAVLAKHKK